MRKMPKERMILLRGVGVNSSECCSTSWCREGGVMLERRGTSHLISAVIWLHIVDCLSLPEQSSFSYWWSCQESGTGVSPGSGYQSRSHASWSMSCRYMGNSLLQTQTEWPSALHRWPQHDWCLARWTGSRVWGSELGKDFQFSKTCTEIQSNMRLPSVSRRFVDGRNVRFARERTRCKTVAGRWDRTVSSTGQASSGNNANFCPALRVFQRWSTQTLYKKAQMSRRKPTAPPCDEPRSCERVFSWRISSPWWKTKIVKWRQPNNLQKTTFWLLRSSATSGS